MLLFPESGSSQTLRSVQQVVYGDTLILDKGEKVQMLGVWAPKPAPGKPDFKPDSAMGGQERRSREFTRGLVQGRQVWTEPRTGASSSSGAVPAYVYFKIPASAGAQNIGGGGQVLNLGPGTYMINRLLVTYGFAEADDKADTPYRAEFEQLEREARASKRGNWLNNF